MCNEYRLPTGVSALFDRFAEIKVPFRRARMVSLRDGVAWCDPQAQGIGLLKVTPPRGTHAVAPVPFAL